MIAVCHILTGAVIVTKTQNPILGLFLTFFSHFILDFIPHREYNVDFKQKLWETSFSDILKVTVDVLLGILIILAINKNLIISLAGGFAAILPDIIASLLFCLPKNPLSDAYYNFHIKKMHSLKNKIPQHWEILTQVSVIFISVFFLLR
jgi:hypothetical protein